MYFVANIPKYWYIIAESLVAKYWQSNSCLVPTHLLYNVQWHNLRIQNNVNQAILEKKENRLVMHDNAPFYPVKGKKGVCTRFEIEHLSCNFLFLIRKLNYFWYFFFKGWSILLNGFFGYFKAFLWNFNILCALFQKPS